MCYYTSQDKNILDKMTFSVEDNSEVEAATDEGKDYVLNCFSQPYLKAVTVEKSKVFTPLQ